MMQPSVSSTILWLTGWSMPPIVFDQLRALLPEFQHESIIYSTADSQEEMIQLVEKAAAAHCDWRSAPVLIAGWSLGGCLALHLATQGLADGLVLFSATAKFTRANEQKHLGWADAYLRRMITGLKQDREATEHAFRLAVWQSADSASDHSDAIAPGQWSTPALLAGLEALRSLNLLPMLPGIKCPVLLVHGTEDTICPFPAAQELHSNLPHATLLAVEGGGHAPFLGSAAWVAASIRSWWHDR
ncbi:alpha/beta fold hydrolase [Paenibacillus roseipurpureus]|uniref:Alpha/beta fold hydrolase n=1 Tax=Paenibacillus roseopurpureus TaxID=2918901 RepID=A0AA96LPI4_9BACL|nr:alpha/beta fold hydrolase [Paenibacillus sp. MBLB1832]WNR44937.1 alpha/beta fold hydrolase [Paenibacillus sp. MBLB1832]